MNRSLAHFGTALIATAVAGAIVTLTEPMIAQAFLDTKPAAASYATHGYQATAYTVGYDSTAKEFRVALSGLVAR